MVNGANAPHSQPPQRVDITDLERVKPVSREGRDPSSRVEDTGVSRSERAEPASSRRASEDKSGREQQGLGLDKEEMSELKEKINETLEPINIALDFEIEDEIEETVVKVKNRDTEEIIRQIPPEALLHMAKRMEEMSGLLIEEWG